MNQRGSGGVLQAREVDARGGEPGLGQGVQERIDRCEIAALQQRAVEDQECSGLARFDRGRAVQPSARQGQRLGPIGRPADQRGGIAQRLLGIVDAAVLQVAAEALMRLGRQGREGGELGVGALVTGQAGQGDAALGATGGDLLHAVGPVAAATEQPDQHETGARHDALDIEVDRQRVAQLEKVGKAQGGGVGAEPGLGGGEAGEIGIGGREEDQIGRRLAEIDRRLDVAAIGGQRAQEMHGGLALIGVAGVLRSSGRPATISRTRSARAAILWCRRPASSTKARLSSPMGTMPWPTSLETSTTGPSRRSSTASRRSPASATSWSASRRLVTHKVRQSTRTARSGRA